MKQRLLLALALGIGLTILVSATMSNRPTRAQGTCDRYVLGIDCGDTTDCSDERHPCRTVQYAIDQASNGDVICVAKHSLAGPLVYEERLVITKSITLDGAWDAMCVDPNNLTCSFTAIPCDPGNVTLDALGAGRVISISGNITPTIDCFTITGGDAAGQGGDPGPTVDNDAGGGIYSRDAAPTIINNVITGNYGCEVCPVSYGRGGGVYLLNAPATAVISNNLIANNVADESTWGQGGGIMLRDSGAQVTSNTIEYNRAGQSAGYGGGMYLGGLISPSLVSGNALEGNIAGYNDDGNGGGIYVDDSEATIADNHLFDNSATWAGDLGYGGGLYVNGGTVLIQSNVITGNFGAGFPGSPSTADGYGGGVAISGSLSIVQDNWIVGNGGTNGVSGAGGAGGGVYGYLGILQITGNTIASNTTTRGNAGFGGGLYLEQVTSWLDGNTILDNEAIAGLYGRGGGIRINNCPAFTLTNNIIARNEASELGSGVAIALSVGQLGHNTIVENLTGDGIGVRVDDAGSTVTLTNNIIVSQTVGISNTNPASSTVVAEYTLFEGNGTDYGAGVASTHEISGPAMLLPNYHLGGGSGAINTAATLSWVTNDIDGESRPFGAAPDVGADEATCLARVGGVDYTVIQDAIDAATPGQTVMVVEGVCYENLSITKTVTLEGGWDVAFSVRNPDPASVSTIDGMGAGRVVSITEVSGSIAPTIDGFTIAHGDATGLEGSGAYHYDIGGGIYGWYADVTVANCVITDNVASADDIAWGGGVGFYGGNVTLRDSVVAGNVASTASNGWGGGGCFRFGTATVSGNTVAGNVGSTAGSGSGGGLWLANGNATLQGNTVRGNVASKQGAGYGGGVSLYSHTVSMDGDVVEGNDANVPGNEGYGGGISAVYSSTLTMDGVVVRDNVAHSDPPSLVFGQGGGVYVDDSVLTLSSSTVASNTAYSGGGVYLYAGDNTILNDNFFTNNDAVAYGGGVYVQNSQAVAFTANLFTDNSVVGDGGGGYILFSDDVTFTANTILSNTDTGVCFYGCKDAFLDNNVIADNEGGVSITGHTTRLRHNTIARNGALGVSVWGYWDGAGTAILTNTILVSHTVGITVTAGNTATLEGTLWGDGAWANTTDWGGAGHIATGTVNVRGIPAFVDPDSGDYHLGPGSAAIDAGVDAGVPTDIDGDPRPIGLGFDIGADEAWRWVFLPLVLR